MNITSYTHLTFITLLTLLTVVNSGILIRTALSFTPNYDFTIMKWVNDRNYNSHVICFKISISIILVSCPILFYNLYTSLSFQNESLNILFLLALSIFTCYLIYYNKNKVWSKKNNINVKGWISDSKRININNEKIKEIKSDQKNTVKSITVLQIASNETKRTTSKHALDIKNLDTNQNKIDKSVSDLKIACDKTEKIKSHDTINKEVKNIESYFKNEEDFKEINNLLQKNNFYSKKTNITATNLAILTCKLLDLKLIYIQNIQKYYCIALATHFGLEKVDAGYLSRITNEHKNKSLSRTHENFFKSLNYLDKYKVDIKI